MSSLRARLWAYLAAAAVASTILTVAIAVILTHQHVESQRLGTLDRQADAVAAAASPMGTRVLLLGRRAGRRRGDRGRVLGPRRARRVISRIGAGAGDGRIDLHGTTFLYAARATPGGRVVLLRPARQAEPGSGTFAWSLVLAGLAGALLAGALSFVLARRLTRPLHEVAGGAARVATGEPGVSVPVRGRDELSRLAASFNAMAGDLERARDAQRGFLLSVSHELKTPLTAIRGYAEALGDGAVPAGEAAAAIEAESLRLQRLVGDLLDLARLDRADFAIERHPVDLARVAAQVRERHATRAAELGVELRVARLAKGGSAMALADHDRLLQAASNLVENALRATPAGGVVTVELCPASLTVRDTGPGLAPEDLPRAFERFYLHDRHRGHRDVGSGLGLAIVRQVVEAMGGHVEVSGAPGRGAAFTLRLAPAQPGAIGADRQPGGARQLT